VTLAWGRPSEAEIAEVVGLAREAIEAGKDDPDVLWMAGFTLLVLAGEHATADSVITRTLALNPNSFHAWITRGWVSAFRNEPGPAIEALQRALRLNPLDPLDFRVAAGLGFAHLVAGQYEEAMQWVDRTLREQPRYTVAVRMKVVLCVHLERIEEARAK